MLCGCGLLSWAVFTPLNAQTVGPHREFPEPSCLCLLQGAASRSSATKVSLCRGLASEFSGHILTFTPSLLFCSFFRKTQCWLLHALFVYIRGGPFHRVLITGPHKHKSEDCTRTERWSMLGYKGGRGMAWHQVHFGGIYLEIALGWDSK